MTCFQVRTGVRGLYELAFIQKARPRTTCAAIDPDRASMNSPSYRRRDRSWRRRVCAMRLASMNSPSYRRRDPLDEVVAHIVPDASMNSPSYRRRDQRPMGGNLREDGPL